MDSADRGRLRRRLLAWFDRHQRDLPWRRNPERYTTWVSEIMLQQTQVATVIEYYRRFIARFPDVATLAAASEEEVLKLWEGLGYYRRARQMLAAARKIVAEHEGQFPREFKDVLALPGIGRYTAGAILSIAEDQPHPILEGNTLRLFARLLALQEDPRERDAERRLWEFSESLLPRKRVGDFNQALMELGALVCTPSQPKCLVCPLASFCRAREEGLQDKIPVRGTPMRYQPRREVVAVLLRRGRVLVRQCGPDEWWTGLWDFPRFELTAPTESPARWLQEQLRDRYGLDVELTRLGDPIRHAVTRYRIELDCFQSTRVTGQLRRHREPSSRWVPVAELSSLPLSATGRKVAGRVLD